MTKAKVEIMENKKNGVVVKRVDKNSFDIVNTTTKDSYVIQKMYPKLKAIIRDSRTNELEKDSNETIKNIIMEKNDLEEEGFYLEIIGKYTPHHNKELTLLTLEVDNNTKRKLLNRKTKSGEAKLAYGGEL
jgi:hypothetical protein